MSTILWRMLSVAVGMLLVAAASSGAEEVAFQDIPPGFDFPADQESLLQYRDTQNVLEMRRHAWHVFAGLTQPATGGEAIWETWYRVDETFDSGPAPAGPRQFQRRFRPPRQFTDPSGLQPLAPGESLMAAVLFNKAAHDWIRDKQFYSRTHLESINNGFGPTTPIADRKIEDFPREAISLKTVWWLVRKTGITPMPVWDFEPTKPDSSGNRFRDWRRIVGVDASRTTIPPGETVQLNFPETTSPPREARVVPLASLYHFEVTPENISSFVEMPQPAPQTPAVGDYVALVNFHFTTKEIPDWVWGTLWWHDRPNDGPYAEGRVATVNGPWRNYLMDVAYSMDTPREYDGTPNACYNPWLEARFVNGMQSNCMTCHQRAVWEVDTFMPVTRGSMSPNDSYFQDRTKLDFLWSLLIENQDQ